jgi:small subunit ribosomal protein S5
MVKVSVKGRTIPHETTGKFGASRVLVKPAAAGTGLIACSHVRAVLEAVGLRDALSKSLGSRNPYNTARATIIALRKLRTIAQVAQSCNKPVSHFTYKVHHEAVESHAGQEPD